MKEASEKIHRVLVPGVFDLLNVGHYKYILQAKQLFKNTEIVIGVMDSAEEMKYVGLTAMTYSERNESIKHVKNVDEVISPCPWVLTAEFLNKHRIDVVVDNQFFPEFKFYKEVFGEAEKIGKLRKMSRMEVPKSYEYLRRILVDVDLYIMRSIERGYKLEDLGISVWKYKYLQMRSVLKKITAQFTGKCLRRKEA